MNLQSLRSLHIRQRKELAELFGWETRNKYEIVSDDGRPLAFAAEQQKGFLGLLFRQLFGHWRRFDIHFFGADRQPFMVARHPFRWIFQRLEVFDATGKFLGALQQRFGYGVFKRFDLENARGETVLEVSSPFWRIWTFEFESVSGAVRAIIRKKWSGMLTEVFTDADNFRIEFTDPSLAPEERQLLLAAGLFIDLQYFERKANSRD